MSKVIAITNQKGGVGKTTTCVNLAASLAATKRKILAIDFDPQGNATVGCGVNKAEIEFSTTDVLLNDVPIEKAIVRTVGSFDLLPSTSDLTLVEVKLITQEGREFFLRNAVESLRDQYDYILIDCPPTLNMLTVNALVAADSVIIPMQCEYYALEGVTSLLSTIDRLRQSANPELQLEGLLRTMYDGRNRLTVEVSDQLKEYFGEKVYHTVIPRNVRLAEAPSYGQPVLQYDKRSQGAAAYLALAGELVHQQEQLANDEVAA